MHRHRVVVDEEKAALSGVSSRQIADVLQVLFEGVSVGRVHLPDERNVVPIRIQVPRRDELRPQDLDRIQLSNAAGQIVPLSELVHVVADHEDEPILHKDNERVIFVGSEYLTGAGLYAVLGLNQRLATSKAGTASRCGSATWVSTTNRLTPSPAPTCCGKARRG